MKQMLQQKILTHVPQRPFGEFNGDYPGVFDQAASAVWWPKENTGK